MIKKIIILGQFDSVHLGHRKLIEEAVSFGKKENAEVFVLLQFSDAIRRLSPREFFENIILKEYGASSVFCGFNYHFGKNAKGNAKDLENMGKACGIKTFILPAVKIKGKEVSSSLIKKFLKEGEVEKANEYLGYEYNISGEVVFGNQIGRTIGFKTANLNPPENKVIPENGVYKTTAIVKNNKYEGMTNIGIRPTVNGKIKIIETNIFSFNEDIYGEKISILFEKKIRDEVTFKGLEELKGQLTKDKLKIKELFKEAK